MKCNYCANYMEELDTCKFCSFEYHEPLVRDDWDILSLKEEDGWEHLQIRDRLHSQGIDCYGADIWYGLNMAYLVGCYCDSSRLAEVLGMHEDAIWNSYAHGFVILNLYQERCLRMGLDIDEMWDKME